MVTHILETLSTHSMFNRDPPSIVSASSSSSRPSRLGSSQTAPMAIPQPCEPSPSLAPPPLPPPRHLSDLSSGKDSAWQWANAFSGSSQRQQNQTRVKQGSSLLGGQHRENQAKETRDLSGGKQSDGLAWEIDDNVEPESQERQSSCVEELRSLRSSPGNNHSLHSEEQLGQRSLENSSQAYDKQLLSKIGKQNTAKRSQTLPSLTQPNKSQEITHPIANSYEKTNTQLPPLSLPERRFTSVDSPTSWRSSRPSSAAVSPANPNGLSSAHERPGTGPRRLSNRTGSGSIVGEDGFIMAKQDRGPFSDREREAVIAEENGVKDLNINDGSPTSDDGYHYTSKFNLKRKASSPPTDVNRSEKARGTNLENAYNNGQQSQSSTNPNYPGFHVGSALSSSVSTVDQHAGSYGSSYAISIASSATSLMSGDRSVPNTYTAMSDHDMASAHSPKAYFASERYPPEFLDERRSSQLQLPAIEQQPTKVRPNGVARKPGIHICDCCPKKPKKFKTKEDLRAHELEKQYTCQYCPNRFKNKNEAERHQNSLHLRRHSWSCAALVNARDVFHPAASPTGAGLPPDACGYCGKEFFSDPVDWVARTDHLHQHHRFGECNQTKKFYRADHFRQHLKHSHAGLSGKWTNMLENACMRIESPVVGRHMGPPPLGSGPTAKISVPLDNVREE